MKKQVIVALGLAVLATPAFASKARLQALGEDNYGSQFINDNRNIWLNAAQINNHKDLVTFEFGTESAGDDAATPRGEGGVYKNHGNLVYGVHFGGASSTGNALRAASGLLAGATPDSSEQNNIDVFVGGDAGMKWGANLGYAKNAVEGSNLSSESMRTRLGVIMGDTQAYANLNLINNAKSAAGQKFEGKLGYQVGLIHAWEGHTLFADYRTFEAENTTQKKDIGLKRLEVGIGHVERLNDKSNLFAKASYLMGEVENKTALGQTSFGALCGTGNAALFCSEYKTSQVPVVVGLETEATSWLTLRGSVGAVVWGSEEDKTNERSIQNATIINAGATLKFGELSVDGVIGNNAGNSVTTNTTTPAGSTTTQTGSANGTDSGVLRTDTLMSRVSMTYRF
jgi:hypothetical protein